eukprot:1341301-Rhodomonas_salina.3
MGHVGRYEVTYRDSVRPVALPRIQVRKPQRCACQKSNFLRAACEVSDENAEKVSVISTSEVQLQGMGSELPGVLNLKYL